MSTVLGLDLGGTNVKATVVDAGGPRADLARSRPTASERGPAAVLATVASLAGELISEAGGVEAVGLALPGHFDPAAGTGTLLPNLAGDWRGRPIAAPLSAELGLPVRLVNDARALALAELRFGAGRGFLHVLCVTLGTGVGGAVVIDGRLYLGTAHAGEIGHTTAQPDGPPCGCGNRGCLDRVVSAAAIAEQAGHPTVQAAAAAAGSGDPQALRAFEAAGTYVGRALADAVVLLWPERIVVGGGVAAAGELLLEPLRAELHRRACLVPAERIGVVAATLGPGAGAIGAALWAAEPHTSPTRGDRRA